MENGGGFSQQQGFDAFGGITELQSQVDFSFLDFTSQTQGAAFDAFDGPSQVPSAGFVPPCTSRQSPRSLLIRRRAAVTPVPPLRRHSAAAVLPLDCSCRCRPSSPPRGTPAWGWTPPSASSTSRRAAVAAATPPRAARRRWRSSPQSCPSGPAREYFST